jgi:succinate-semialdehyde dehydrogenase/glutarate-semialdehyde dehydrogenase
MADQIISINPATLEEIGRFPITTDQKVIEYVSEARAACPMWHRMGFEKRAMYLLRAREYLLDHIDDFARAITLDNGKPLVEALAAEIYPVADLIFYFVHHAERLLRPFNVPIGVWNLLNRKSRISFQPLGVVGVISPWNYPFSIPAGEVAMALLCGNSVLLKPSSSTPLVGQKIAEMFEAARLPEGVFTLVQGDSGTGNALVESHVDKILFTGSLDVGKHIMTKCAERMTPLVLELGGKDPMVVRADADLDCATSGAVWGAFTNSGQCCASVERVYVHESIFDMFVEMALQKTKRLRQGNGMDPAVDVGPMTTLSQLQAVEVHVEEAKQRGATIHCGGQRNQNLPGYFFPPTILTGVDHSFRCVREETFGPLMPIMPFADDRQAIQLANDTPYGLTASIWSKDIKTAKEMALEIRAGTVMINDCVFTHALCQTPWGGRKASGFGRSHSRFGLQELVTIHHIHTNKMFRKDFWWYPYSATMIRSLARLTKRLTGNLFSKISALPSFFKIFRMKKT